MQAGREEEALEEEAGATGLVEAGSGAGAQEEVDQPSQATTPGRAGVGLRKTGGRRRPVVRRRESTVTSRALIRWAWQGGNEGFARIRSLAISLAALLMPSLPPFLSSLAISRVHCWPLLACRLDASDSSRARDFPPDCHGDEDDAAATAATTTTIAPGQLSQRREPICRSCHCVSRGSSARGGGGVGERFRRIYCCGMFVCSVCKVET